MRLLVDCRIAAEIKKRLPAVRVIPLPPDPNLDPPVASHPDMLFYVGNHTLVCDHSYRWRYEPLFNTLLPLEKELVASSVERNARYPYDIGLNAVRVGKYLFCREKYTVPEVKRDGGEIVNVRQGYAACSALVLSDRCIVTSDPSIERAASQRNIDVARIRPGGIRLPGYDTGFIGGASVVFEDTVFFFGDPSSHPDFSIIETACHSFGYRLDTFFDGALMDFGGAKLLP